MINNFISFKGCVPEYKRSGMTIKPISKNPTEDEIEKAISATKDVIYKKPDHMGTSSDGVTSRKTDHIGSGMNGAVYSFGQDLVVKRYNSNAAYEREASALDLIYEDKINIPNSQKGMYGFKTDDASYLVSTRVKGAKSDPLHNKFNTTNLNSILNIMFEMDKPVLDKPVLGDFNINNDEKVNFPFKNPMHWDLSIDNVIINEENAGLIDFEYLNYNNHDNLLNAFAEQDIMPYTALSYDIPGVMLNISGFESRCLYVYLNRADKDTAVKTFDDYLRLKSDYHQKRYKMFSDMESPDNKVQKQIDRMKRSELAHSNILKNPNKYVKHAEAIKMQMNRWIFKQSGAEISTEEKINPEQIKKYIKDADDLFNQRKEASKTEDEYIYWDDCSKLSKGWQELSKFMNYRMVPIIPLENICYSIDGKNVSFDELPEPFKKHVEDFRKMCQLFQEKMTDKKTKTLDEKVCFKE